MSSSPTMYYFTGYRPYLDLFYYEYSDLYCYYIRYVCIANETQLLLF
jgi:hypothetical protein